MSDTAGKLQLEAVLNVDGVVSGANTAAGAVSGMAASVSASAEKTGKSIAGIGGAAAPAAESVDRATRSMISSIERTSAAMNAGSKSSSDYYRVLAEQRGIDVNQLKPYLDSLEAVEAKQKLAKQAIQATTPVVEQLGMSSKATAAAMRTVPAQFTDIVVSLQGGQKPLTVLLQQGGQLKDMFGGVGGAMKAMGTYVMALVNPYTVAASAVGVLAFAWNEGRKEAEAFNRAIIMSGDASGATLIGLQKQAEAVGKATGQTTGAAAQALALFAANGNIASSSFEKFGAVALKIQKETGVAVADTVKQFADLGKDPLAASFKLNEQYHYLTLSVYEQIKALEEQGKTLEAGKVAQAAFGDEMNNRMPALTANLGLMEQGWREVAKAAKGAWDAMLNVGRKGDPISDIQKQIDIRTERVRDKFTGSVDTSDKELIRLKEQLAYHEHIAASDKDRAAWAAELSKQAENQIAFDKQHDQFLSKSEQKTREIAKATEEYNKVKDVPGNAQKYLETLTGIEKKYKETRDTANDAYAALALGFQKEIDLSEAALKIGRELTESEKFRITGAEKIADALAKKTITSSQALALELKLGNAVDDRYAREQQILMLKGSNANIANNLAYIQEENNALIQQQTARASVAQAIWNLNSATEEQNGLIDIEVQMAGTTSAQRAIAISQYKTELDLKRQIDIIDKTHYDGGESEREDVRQKARAASEKKGLAEIRQINESEWQRTAESIQTSLTDAFMNSIDSAKSLFVNLRDTIVNMFKTLILRPIVSAVMNPIGQGVAGMVGTMGTAGAEGLTGGTGILGSLGSSAAGTYISSAVSTGISSFATGWSAAGYEAAMGASFVGPSVAGAAGSMGAGAGAYGALAAVPVAGWIALAVVAAYTLFHKEFKSAVETASSSGSWSASGIGSSVSKTGLSGSTTADAIVSGLHDSYAGMAASMGIGTVATNFSFGSNTGREGQNPNFTMGATAGTSRYVSTTGDASLFAPHEVAATDANIKLEVSRSLLMALSSSDLPKSLQGVFDGIDIPNMSQDQIDTYLNTAKSFADLHKQLQELPFVALQDMSYKTAAALVAASGGMQQFGTNLGTFYSNFYSPAEQAKQTNHNIAATLNTAGGHYTDAQITGMTRSDYRSLVEASMLDTTDSGVKFTAALLSMSGSFASTHDAATEATAAVDDYAAAIKSAGDKMTADASSLAADLMRAQGNTRGGDLLAMGITDPNKDAATAAVVAQYDANEATRAQIQALKDYKSAMDSAAQTTASLAVEVLRAQGNDAGATALEHANALAAATKGLSAEQAAAVTATMNQNWATQEWIDTLKAGTATLKTNAGFQDQLDVLQGKRTQRQVDRDNQMADVVANWGKTTDNTTIALLQQIWAQEDLNDATTAAAAAAKTLADNLSAAATSASSALLDANRAYYNQQQADAAAAAQAQQASAQAAQQAAQAALDAAAKIRDAFASAGQSIMDFVNTLRGAMPGQDKINYQSDLALAQGGDLAASQRIPTSGRSYLDSQIAGSATLVDAQRASARMANELSALPAVKTYQDKLLDAVNGVAAAVGGTTTAVVNLHDRFMVELTLSARSEIAKIIDFTINDGNMTPETKALALLATGSVSRLITLASTSLLKPEDQELALTTGGDIVKTISLATKNNDPLALGIAFAQSSSVERIITASGGILTPDQQTLLSAIDKYNKTINIDVVVSSDSLTAFQQLLMTTFGTVDIGQIGNTNGLGGLNIKDLFGAGAIDRLNSIATYIKTLDWSETGRNASAWATYDAAKTYGVTQQDIANATGYKLFDIRALFDGAKVPRFDVGTNNVPRDMLAMIHQGEAIVPKAYNPALHTQARDEAVVAEIRALREEVRGLRSEAQATAGHTAKTSRLLDRAMPDGDALATRVAV